jgi:intracellular sulfur oxidation DsrE/DsrF family protein
MTFAAENSPWGVVRESYSGYKPQKVLYDLTTGEEKKIINILDRVSYLNTLYGNDPFDSSTVVIIHGESIPFFTKAVFEKYKSTVTRAYNLTVGTTIEFRMCQASAKLQGFKPSDIHGFVKMVPMADAEMIKLQKEEGYAYMQ